MKRGGNLAWDEKTLAKDLKTALRGLYVLYGEEAYLVAHYTEQIAKKAVSDDLGGFNLQRFDGETADAAQIEEAIDALPLMAERKCVVVRDLDITAGDRAERLLPLLEDLPETTVVVLYYMQLQPQMKNAKWKRLLEAATKNGAAVCLAKKTPAELSRTLCSGATRRGCTLTPQNAALLVEQCGEDMLLLTNELDKLAALSDGGEITAEMIRTAATKNLEARVFDLSKALLRHRRDEAFGILDTLLQQREEPVGILAVLTNSYVDMYRMKVAQIGGRSAAEVAAAFPAYKGKEFRLRYAAQDAATLSVEQLRRALAVLADADTALKSSGTQARFVLETTLTKLL